jgi:uncharacterized protein YrzB (UPF0473 family)
MRSLSTDDETDNESDSEIPHLIDENGNELIYNEYHNVLGNDVGDEYDILMEIMRENDNNAFEELRVSSIEHFGNLNSFLMVYNVDETHLAKNNETSEKMVDNECPICYEEMSQCHQVTSNCNHVICNRCMLLHLNTFKNKNKSANCPMCRQQYTCLETKSNLAFCNISQFLDEDYYD